MPGDLGVPVEVKTADGRTRNLALFSDRPFGARVLKTRGGGRDVEVSTLIDVDTGEEIDVMEIVNDYGPHEEHFVSFLEMVDRRGSLTYEQTLAALEALAGQAVDVWVEPGSADGPVERQILVGQRGEQGGIALEKSWSFAVQSDRADWVLCGTFDALGVNLSRDKFDAAVVDETGVVVVGLKGGPRFHFVPRNGEERPIAAPPRAEPDGQRVDVGWQEPAT